MHALLLVCIKKNIKQLELQQLQPRTASVSDSVFPSASACPLPQKEKKRLERELRETDAKLTGDGGFEDRVLKAVRCCRSC